MADVAVVISTPGAADSKHIFRDLTPLWPDSVTPLFHNLAGVSGEHRRRGYSWQDEVDRLAAQINVLTDERVYLLGLSAGASLAIAYIAQHPRQIAGIGLIEPAWSFLPLSEKERHYYADLDKVLALPPNEQRDAFVRLLVLPGVETPTMTATAAMAYQQAHRPEETVLTIVTRAMQAHRVQPAQLGRFRGDVYLAIGGRSSRMWVAQAAQIKAVLPQTVVDVYLERHHLDGPHHSEAIRLSRALRTAWHLY